MHRVECCVRSKLTSDAIRGLLFRLLIQLENGWKRKFITKEFVGPMSCLHLKIASSATSSSPTQKSDVINLTSFSKKDFPLCSA